MQAAGDKVAQHGVTRECIRAHAVVRSELDPAPNTPALWNVVVR